jgi:hypothetical protein
MSQAKLRKPSTYSIVVASAILVTALVLRIVQAVDAQRPHLAEITVAGRIFRAEVADTAAKQTQGLSGRAALAPDQAMYFPMARPDRWAFWMKDMRFPLDIVWIQGGKVLGVAADLPPPNSGELPRTVVPEGPADAVLEINANQAAQSGIVPGVDVKIRSLGR